jgi:endoglucanase
VGGGENLGWSDANDWTTFELNIPSPGNYKVTYRVASDPGGAVLRLEEAGENGALYGRVNVPNTGGWQEWIDVDHTIYFSNSGVQQVGINFEVGGANLNYFKVEKVNTPCTNNCAIRVEAESYFAQSGTQTETTTDVGGGRNVGWLDAGDWMRYSISPETSGNYTLTFRVASKNSGQLGINNQASLNINTTNGWQNWTTVTKDIYLNAGTQTLQLNVLSGNFNINWFEYEKK